MNNHTSVECNSSQDKVEAFRQSQQANQGVSQLIDGTITSPGRDESQSSTSATSPGPTNAEPHVSQLITSGVTWEDIDGVDEATNASANGAATDNAQIHDPHERAKMVGKRSENN